MQEFCSGPNFFLPKIWFRISREFFCLFSVCLSVKRGFLLHSINRTVLEIVRILGRSRWGWRLRAVLLRRVGCSTSQGSDTVDASPVGRLRTTATIPAAHARDTGSATGTSASGRRTRWALTAVQSTISQSARLTSTPADGRCTRRWTASGWNVHSTWNMQNYPNLILALNTSPLYRDTKIKNCIRMFREFAIHAFLELQSRGWLRRNEKMLHKFPRRPHVGKNNNVCRRKSLGFISCIETI